MASAAACRQPELPREGSCGSQQAQRAEGRGQRAQPFSPRSLVYLLSLQIPHTVGHVLSAVQNEESLC